MSAPLVKGWCPGAHRPMASGDGLVVRVRPFRGELSAVQVLALCELAKRHGSGTLDLTSRTNLQIRGVAEADHTILLAKLDELGLIDADPSVEGHRNILVSPDRRAGDLTDRLYTALLETLPHLPKLPEKMGFVLDTGAEAVLGGGSGDFRFERTAEGTLILRADGAPLGRPITEGNAMQALAEMAEWFFASDGRAAGRMARHLRTQALPEGWEQHAPRPAAPAPQPGPFAGGTILGAAFGALDADALSALVALGGVTALRPMLGRLFLLTGGTVQNTEGFVTDPGSPLLRAHACPGAPLCPQATVETRGLAGRLATTTHGSLHVSGCAKGCARQAPCDVTLVGRDGAYDLVRGGTASDTPQRQGIPPNDLNDLTGMI